MSTAAAFWASYLIIGVTVAVLVTRRMQDEFKGDQLASHDDIDDLADRFFAGVVGLFAGFLWPLVAVIAVLILVASHIQEQPK
jgi:hypothetical protein